MRKKIEGKEKEKEKEKFHPQPSTNITTSTIPKSFPFDQMFSPTGPSLALIEFVPTWGGCGAQTAPNKL